MRLDFNRRERKNSLFAVQSGGDALADRASLQ
jgi:hypothetical protein